jgi:hypothetical protein
MNSMPKKWSPYTWWELHPKHFLEKKELFIKKELFYKKSSQKKLAKNHTCVF